MKENKMCQKQLFLFFLFCWSIVPSQHCLAQKLYLLIACDVEGAKIGASVTKDQELISTVFQQYIPTENLNILAISTPFSEQSVLNMIKRLPVRRDDTVMFYYSGHGLYDYDQGTQIFTLSNKENISRKKVLEAIHDKNPRLAICISDCCNAILSRFSAEALANPEDESESSIQYPGIKKLFFETRGVVDLTSSRISEVSLTCRQNGIDLGGLFTYYFVEFLNDNASNRTVEWLDLLKSAQPKMTRYFQTEFPKGIDKLGDIKKTIGMDWIQKDQRIYFYQCPGLPKIRFGVAMEDAPQQGGAKIVEIFPDTPAENGGLRVGDVITQINGAPVTCIRDADILIDHSPQLMRLQTSSGKKKVIELTF